VAKKIDGSALTDYGAELLERCAWTCAYCGYDGRSFDAWRQLSVDHVLPLQCGGEDTPANTVAACRWCNDVMNAMRFDGSRPVAEILEEKKRYVAARLGLFRSWWSENVAKCNDGSPRSR
jgi:hypothetical protein